jgi:hypothetical protein
MRFATFTLIGALGLAATAVSARAAPVVPNLDAHQASGIVQVWGGCGPGFRPVPGHWSQWRGAWIPPHCAPNHYGGGYGGGYYGRGYGGGYYGGGYGGGYPYWQHRY